MNPPSFRRFFAGNSCCLDLPFELFDIGCARLQIIEQISPNLPHLCPMQPLGETREPFRAVPAPDNPPMPASSLRVAQDKVRDCTLH